MFTPTLSDDAARDLYQRFHTGELSQADLSKRVGISISSLNQIVRAKSRFRFLATEFPSMPRRSTERARVKTEPKPRIRKKAAKVKAAPVQMTPVAVIEEADPAIDLASQALDTFYGLCPATAVLLAKFATAETLELLELADRKPCSRLLAHLPQLKGRPPKASKGETIRHQEAEDPSVGEKSSEELLEVAE